MKTLAGAIFSKAGGSVFTLGLVVYLAHAIGPQASGYFYFTLAVAMMLSQLLRLGMDGVVLRMASRYHQTGDDAALRLLAGDMLACLLACGGAMVLLGLALEQHAAPLIFAGEFGGLLYEVALYSFVPFSLMWVCASLLKGMGKTSLSVFIEAGSVPLFVLLVMQSGTADYHGAVRALLWANLLAAALAVALVFRHAGCRMQWSGLLSRCKALLEESIDGVWVAVSNTLIVWLPLFLLGLLATPTDVGLYNAAFRVTMVIGAFSPVFRGVATPRLAGLLHRKESPVPFLKKSMAHIVAAGVLALLLADLTMDWLFAHFGAGFAPASGLATLMLVGMLANVLFVIMETHLILDARNDLLRSNTVFTLLLSLPLTLLLIRYLQAYGAALAFVVANVLSRGNMLYLFNRMYGCRI